MDDEILLRLTESAAPLTVEFLAGQMAADKAAVYQRLVYLEGAGKIKRAADGEAWELVR